MESILKGAIQKALSELFGVSDAQFSVDRPKEMAHGDYATNAPLAVAKQLRKSPKEIAEVLSERLQHIENVMDVSVAGAGFINFKLSPEYFSQVVSAVFVQKENWGKSEIYKNKKILVEHSSPNLFKPFHIGHLMNNTIGESITRLARFSGANVTAMSFPSDISLGIAKAIFIILEKIDQGGEYKWDDIVVLGNSYVEGTKRYDEDGKIHERVKEIAKNLYELIESRELDLFRQAKELNITYFEAIVSKLGSRFDSYIYESEAGIDGKKIVEENVPNVFTKSDGATVYVPDESRKDINTAVFINSHGNPTYEAKDIGLIDMKFKRFAPDISIFITDVQQIPHFDVVLAAAEKINGEWKDRVMKSTHIAHGRMSFKGQKMSSRLGGVPLVEDILATVRDEVKEKNADSTENDAQAIGIAALKFSILRAQAGKNIDFDPEESLSFVGDSGPYLQYSAVRAKSVLAKADIPTSTELPTNWETTDLERTLVHFPEIVERSIKEWAPHHVVSYLLELAQTFNSWYGNTKINDNSKSSGYKLALTQAFAQTLQNGLFLLGIEVPEKM